ncbi:MAG: flagellar basal body L-ring protein FlgH [Gemmatimonadaceae bacterium]|jgi:flagellar L-ring protein precursor FlgH|nr:flagellar basal body L-ring protein FlgH [Gemmatimonadaceae bacterium]
MNRLFRHLRVLRMLRELVWPALVLCAIATPVAAQEEGADSTAAAPAAAPAPRGRASWISDRRSFAIGDVLTVMVDEFTLASANLGNTSTNNRRNVKDASVNVRMPASSMGGSAGLSATDNTEQNQRGEAVRQNRFQSEMTVRVVEVLAGGVLRVEGRKVLNVDKNAQEVVMSGFVRPQDVGPFNQVDSWRVGELRLDYKAEGQLGKPKQGILGRVFGFLVP